ncbi:MAG: YceD family protein [Acidimicrobiia bacterium]
MNRSPFVLSVADLLGRDASPRAERLEAEVDWRIELSRVMPEPPLVADLLLHPVSGGIAVTGKVHFTTEDSCSRCLTATISDRSSTVGALFDRNDEDDESYPLEGTEIDVEQMLRDDVLLSLPLTPSCGPDCPGVVTSAGTDLNTDSSESDGESRSPFAVLKDLLDDEE